MRPEGISHRTTASGSPSATTSKFGLDRSAVAAELGTPPVFAYLASLDQVRALARTLLEQHPRIDVLVHNAGATYPERIET